MEVVVSPYAGEHVSSAKSGCCAVSSSSPVIGTEAQERCDIAGFVEFLVVFYVEQLQAVTYGKRNDGVGYVFELSRLSTTGRATSHQVRVQMSATGALHGGVPKIVPQEKRLYLPQFKRVQHPAKASDSQAIALGLVENLPHQLVTAAGERLMQNAGRLLPDLVVGQLGYLGRKPSQHTFSDIGV